MPLASGERLGPYEISKLIGAGGMGEVYRALDTRLKRAVAIKVLRPESLADESRGQRFLMEARAVSRLSHPHICSLFDVGEQDGAYFLVMEFLDGETLRSRLARGPIPIPEALQIAVQIGEALSHTHSQGLAHRDLKPDNIMLTGSNRRQAKLLDFGLARVFSRSAPQTTTDAGPAQIDSLAGAEATTISGTFPYLSPEQLRGEPGDARTDIFAFGAVLYEMITGRMAFQGENQASLISAILLDQPPPASSLQPNSSAALDRAISKCLAKDPAERWQTARDLVDELKWTAESGPPSIVAPRPASIAAPRSAWRKWAPVAILAAAGTALLAMMTNRPRDAHSEAQTWFEISLPSKANMGDYDFPVVSPDGRRAVFPVNLPDKRHALLIRKLDSLDIQPLPGTDGAMYPFWSPDSRSVGFFADGKLKKIDTNGGSLVTLADVPGGLGGSWNSAGEIIFCPKLDSPLQRVRATGGVPVTITQLDQEHYQTSQFFPEFLPDGKHFLFYGVSAGREQKFNGAYIGSLDSQEVTPLFHSMGRVSYAPPGYLLFPRGDSLLAQPFDTDHLRVTGEPGLVVEQVGNLGMVLGSAFGASQGTLVYRRDGKVPPTLTWMSRSGEKLATVGEPGDYDSPALSPDGASVALESRESPGQPRSIFLVDMRSGKKSRLTFDAGDHFNAVWSPDGLRIAFTSSRNGKRDLYQKLVDGSGPEAAVLESEREKNLEDWSKDGKYLLFNARTAGEPIELWALPLFGRRQPFKAAASPDASCEEGQISPDGHWIAYRSVQSGRHEIFVQTFPPTGGRWQVSTSGGREPQWRRDGRELFYLDNTKLMAVDVRVEGPRFHAGVPHALFNANLRGGGRNMYVASPDGQRFLMIVGQPETAATAFTVLTGWANRLR